MKRAGLLLLVWIVWWCAANAPLSRAMNLAIVFGGVLLAIPVAWLGRRRLARPRTASGVAWTTTLVHFALGFAFGVPIVLAIGTYRSWPGPVLPVPSGIGVALVILTGAACLLTIANLALRGLGAPFFIALSRKVATDWMYAWTRNPMVLAGLALLVSLGLWFQSALFVLWAICLFAPALLAFVKLYEERELELRFGASYRDYKSRTPMLLPRRPRPIA